MRFDRYFCSDHLTPNSYVPSYVARAFFAGL